MRGRAVVQGVDTWATEMRAIDAAPQHRGTLIALRWVLIAICAGLIVFSDHVAGRLGFAALLLLAVIVGRYGRNRFARPLRPPARVDQQQAAARHASDLPRREAGK